MKYKNAYDGIKLIYLSEVLTLIGALTLVASALLTLLLGADEVADVIALVTMLLSLVGGLVLMLVAYILSIVGIVKGSRDEDGFRAALLFVLFGILLSVLSAVFNASANPVLNGIFTVLGDVARFAVTIFIIQAIRNIADRRNNGAVSEHGRRLLLIALIITALTLAAHVLGFFPLIVPAILSLAAAVLSIVMDIAYLVYLSKAKKMLA